MWDDAKQLNALSAFLAGVVFLLLAAGGLAWLVRQPVFAFREIVVRGPLERASAAHLEAIIRDELAGTFFTMNLDASRAALARVPWVRKVALRRQWPRRLEIEIEEHSPLARWNDGALVSTEGEIFIADYEGDLPQFSGGDRHAAEVAARYREWSAALAPLKLTVREIALSPRGGWRIGARGDGAPLAIEIGRDEAPARLARFIAAYGRTLGVLARNGVHVAQVDLRYRNGFAARVPGFKERPPKKTS